MMKFIALLGRICFSSIFILSGISHFSQNMIAFGAEHGVPYASYLVPAAGLVALFGGVNILVGFYPRVGAWLLVAFLVPVTLTMHRFWGVADTEVAMLQQIMFMKNVSMLGGALIIAYFGSGPLSMGTSAYIPESEAPTWPARRHVKATRARDAA